MPREPPILRPCNCNICSSSESADTVYDELDRLKALPFKLSKLALTQEKGSLHAALSVCENEIFEIKQHWLAMSFEDPEEYNNGMGGLSKEECDANRARLEQEELNVIALQKADVLSQMAIVEKQIEAHAGDPDPTLVCFCSSSIAGAWDKHYMCQTCYDAWRLAHPAHQCPWCRSAMRQNPVYMTSRP